MTVKNGDFIKIDYNEIVEGEVIFTTDQEIAKAKGIYDAECQYGPSLIVIGAGQLVLGFEEDLIGKEIGYSGQVEVLPEKGFGKRDPKKVETVPITRFKEEKPIVGMRVGMEGRYGIVSRIIGRKVSVDFNHPLADKIVVYDFKLLESVEDKQEKLRALIKTFAKIELEAKIEGDVAIIIVPWEMNYYKEWLMLRHGLADMIIQHLSLSEVDYIEKHTGEKVKAELISPKKDIDTSKKDIDTHPEMQIESSSESSA